MRRKELKIKYSGRMKKGGRYLVGRKKVKGIEEGRG